MLARGTPKFIYIMPFLALLPLAVWAAGGDSIFLAITIAWSLFTFILLLFFRDPKRFIGEGIVSPADGRVSESYVKNGRAFVSIFMNVHNVHVNRAPLAGTVMEVRHIPGGYVPAFKKESEANERVITRLGTPRGAMIITQIAGTVARRIVPYLSAGDKVEKGDRIGLIRFGSRVDVGFTLPGNMELKVKEGDRVLAGSTTIADLRGIKT
jgi:phosphatidylserine decarboxylase